MTDREKIQKLKDALHFYADPDSYFAIGFLADRPCGGFMDDFCDKHGIGQYDRPMPGKLARKTLLEIEKI
jgi:hypothetical protein